MFSKAKWSYPVGGAVSIGRYQRHLLPDGCLEVVQAAVDNIIYCCVLPVCRAAMTTGGLPFTYQ